MRKTNSDLWVDRYNNPILQHRPSWTLCNHMVLSWLLNSIHGDLYNSIIHSEKVNDMWSELHEQIIIFEDQLSTIFKNRISVAVYYDQ